MKHGFQSCVIHDTLAQSGAHTINTLLQFASRREFQRNNNHLLTVRMKTGESLKSYVNYFQSQMVLVYNYNKDVAATAFISGLQVILSFYKNLVKNDVTEMRDILVRA